jgi:hypothetical protein
MPPKVEPLVFYSSEDFGFLQSPCSVGLEPLLLKHRTLAGLVWNPGTSVCRKIVAAWLVGETVPTVLASEDIHLHGFHPVQTVDNKSMTRVFTHCAHNRVSRNKQSFCKARTPKPGGGEGVRNLAVPKSERSRDRFPIGPFSAHHGQHHAGTCAEWT